MKLTPPTPVADAKAASSIHPLPSSERLTGSPSSSKWMRCSCMAKMSTLFSTVYAANSYLRHTGRRVRQLKDSSLHVVFWHIPPPPLPAIFLFCLKKFSFLANPPSQRHGGKQSKIATSLLPPAEEHGSAVVPQLRGVICEVVHVMDGHWWKLSSYFRKCNGLANFLTTTGGLLCYYNDRSAPLALDAYQNPALMARAVHAHNKYCACTCRVLRSRKVMWSCLPELGGSDVGHQQCGRETTCYHISQVLWHGNFRVSLVCFCSNAKRMVCTNIA